MVLRRGRSYDNTVNVILLRNTPPRPWTLCTIAREFPRNALPLWIFCTRQHFVVPPLSHTKRLEFCECLARYGCITHWLYHKTNT